MRRTLAALLVAVCVVLAGCGGVPGSSGDAPTTAPTGAGPTDAPFTTTAPPATDGTTGDGLADVDYPAGLAATGVTDRRAFLSTFMATLENSTVAINQTRDTVRGEGVETNTTLRWNSSAHRLYYHFANNSTGVGPDEDSFMAYVSDHDEFRWNWYRSSEGSYLVTAHPPNATRYLQSVALPLSGFLASSNLTAAAVRTEGETTLVEYELTGFTRVVGETERRYANATGRLVVDEDGLVRTYEVAFPEPLASGWSSMSFTLEVGDQRITEPFWAGEANATTAAG